MGHLLEVENLCKLFGKFEALKGLHFIVDEGEIISVLGPSGCGKSTLLQIVAGLQAPDKGIIRLRGKEMSSPHYVMPPEKRKMNMVFQDFALWPHMDVFENIAYGLRRQKLAAAEIHNMVWEMLELLHLSGLEKRLPPQLSGGQQQRVAIARALATKPSILLLDEPLSNLDVQLRIEMRTEMAYLFRRLGTTVFHVTHDPTEAFALADRLIIMRQGAIDQIDSPKECFRRPASTLVASLLGAGNRLVGKAVYEEDAAAALVGGDYITGVRRQTNDTTQSENFEIRFHPEDAQWSPEPGWTDNILHVQVKHSAFEGKHHRILANTTDGQQISFLYNQWLESGREGILHLPKTDVFLYPA